MCIALCRWRRGKVVPCLVFALLLSVLFGCGEPTPKEGRSAYYWKTVFGWDKGDTEMARALGVHTLYIRYFDVGLVDNKVLPVAPVQNLEAVPGDLRIVPVVYITLEALESLTDSAASDSLARHIVQMVSRLHKSVVNPSDELQIDCDWTASGRERYFLLLRRIKEYSPAKVSATIRLHQVKFVRKTGVPPVDRGMLMVYNMGHPGKTGERNSIIDAELVESYVKELGAYPLPLDYAFPLFSWAVLFHGGQYAGLLRDIGEDELETCEALERSGDHAWRVVRSGRLRNVRLRRGDRIRYDASGVDEVLDAARMVQEKALSRAGSRVSVFSWDELQIKRFGKRNIGRIYEKFE